MDSLNDVIFYSIDKTIRTYRQFAQNELKKAGFKITIDQWLVIKNILENPGITQNELAVKVFKDNASVTRIIDLLVKAGYLEREISSSDRRRTTLKVTKDGNKVISQVQKVVLKNRATALKGITAQKLSSTKLVLETITNNCL
jgi:DNA-binding MarR family transcriptional regulator